MSNWTHSMCEVCWIRDTADWKTTLDGVAEELISVRRPALIQYPADETPPIEQCCFCGAPTIWGCYVRRNPKEVLFCSSHDK